MPWSKPAPGYEPTSNHEGMPGPTFTNGLNGILKRIERLEQILGVQQLSGEISRCLWWTDGNSWALWSGTPAKRRCTLAAGHDGDHR